MRARSASTRREEAACRLFCPELPSPSGFEPRAPDATELEHAVAIVTTDPDAMLARLPGVRGALLVPGPSFRVERRSAHLFVIRVPRGSLGSLASIVTPLLDSIEGMTEDAASIATLEHANEVLRKEKYAAEAASEAKSLFLAMMSHEIRTPMNGVVGMLDLLHETTLATEQREMVSTARDSALSLVGILDDVLDFSKIEAGMLDLESIPVDVGCLVESVAETLAANAEKKHVELQCFVAPSMPRELLTDPVRLRQILFNLASNAIKFTESTEVKAGRVVIEAAAVDVADTRATLRIAVRDNGLGMSRDTLERLFQPFVQAELSTQRRFGGTGLGLSICRRLVDQMGGTIRVSSTPGLGTEFEIDLPLPLTREATEVAIPELAGTNVLRIVRFGETRTLVDTYLTEARAHVVARDSLEEAEALLRDEATRVDVVVFGPAFRETLAAAWLEKMRKLPSCSRLGGVVFVTRSVAPRGAPSNVVRIVAPPLHRSRLLLAVARAAGRSFGNAEPDSTFADASRPDVDAERGMPTGRTANRTRAVLVADDDATSREVLRRQLVRLGHEVVLAPNGLEALARYLEMPFAMVLADRLMPELDGIGLARAIRANEAGRATKTPIVIVTASALRGEAARCRDAGADECLVKPFELRALAALMERLLGDATSDEDARPRTRRVSRVTRRYDPDALARTLGGNGHPEAHASLIRIYLEAVPRALAVLEEARKRRDAASLAFEAHKLKSASLSIGAVTVGRLCAALESFAAVPDWDGLSRTLVAIERAVTAVLPSLEGLANV